MTVQGHIENGVVVFDEPVSLTEGTAVRVELVAASMARWDAAAKAVGELKDYDYDAVADQKECDLRRRRKRK